MTKYIARHLRQLANRIDPPPPPSTGPIYTTTATTTTTPLVVFWQGGMNDTRY